MDDERIERALRQGPPDEPTYQAGRFAATVGRARPASMGGRRRLWGALGGTFRFAATSVVALLVVAGVLLLRSGNPSVGPSPSPGPVGGNDLLARVRTTGVIRIAIVPDYPNALLAGGAYDGIDTDVAREIATRLGLKAEIVPVVLADLTAGGWAGRWDVAVGITITRTAQHSLTIGRPFRYQPAVVAVRSDLRAAHIADLTGSTICVGPDAAVGQWLDGTLDVVSATPVVAPPSGITRQTEPSDTACTNPATTPTFDAFVGDRQLPSDFSPAFRVLAQPAFTEAAAVAADSAGPSPTSLLAAVDDALANMHSDGTLTTISARRFGGTDVTVAP